MLLLLIIGIIVFYSESRLFKKEEVNNDIIQMYYGNEVRF